MSSIINPVGPDEPSTYWRRRAVVIVVLLVILWVLWMLVGAALGGGDDKAADAPTPEPSFGLTMTPEPEGSEGASPPPTAPSEDVSPTPSPSPSVPTLCADEDISVAAGTAAPSTAVGAGLGLTLTVTNNGSTACTRDVGAGANELQVTSGSVLVWSSDFCNPSKAEDVQTLDAGEKWTTSLSWPGTIVTKDCPADPATAQPGNYRVVARNGDLEGEPVAFVVE